MFEKDEVYVPAAIAGVFSLFLFLGGGHGMLLIPGFVVIFYISFRIYRFVKSKTTNGALHHWRLEKGFARAVTEKDKQTDESLRIIEKNGGRVYPEGFEIEFQE